MHATLRSCGAHVHKPLIRFLGKRTPSSAPQPPHPHPAAPPEVVSHFGDFLKRFNSSLRTSSAPREISSSAAGNKAGSHIFHEYWEAPSRYWTTSHQIDETEIEAILSGGASLR